jgi:hypothetical protein
LTFVGEELALERSAGAGQRFQQHANVGLVQGERESWQVRIHPVEAPAGAARNVDFADSASLGKQGFRASRSIDGRSAGQFNPQRSFRRGGHEPHAISGRLSDIGPGIATRAFPAFSSIAAPRRGSTFDAVFRIDRIGCP